MRRIDSLDALRGIAALVVVISHCVLTLPGLTDDLMASYLARPFLAGPSAVSVFFVLSGFVLFLTLERQDHFATPRFLVKRVARIYPPLVAAILLSMLLYLIVRPHEIPALSPWFNDKSWNTFPTAKILIGHLLLLDGIDYQNLDNVVWSLAHELRISLIFPLLAIAVRRRMWQFLALSIGVSILCRIVDGERSAHSWIDLLATLKYLYLFVAGAALASRRDSVKAWLGRPACRFAGRLLLLTGIVLVSFDPAFALGLLIDLGAICLVVACFADRGTERCLSWPPIIWLGRVSYSLYLVHLPVLLTIVHLFHGRVPVGFLVAMVLPVSLMLAELGFRFVERPSIRMGRWVADRIAVRRYQWA